MQGTRIFFAFVGCMLAMNGYAANTSQPMPWPSSSPQSSSPSTSRTTGGAKDALNLTKQMGTAYLNNQFKQVLSKWLTRTDINYTVQEKHQPVASIETIQPLFLNDWHTLFVQGRVGYNDAATTGNLGLGYRYLTHDKRWLMGVSTFYDQNFQYTHKRIGLGGELFNAYLAFRANYYNAYSGKRQITTTVTEQALDGYDGSIEAPIPFVPWIRFRAEGYHWDAIKADNVNGGVATFRVFFTRQLEVDLGVAEDNSQGGQAFLQLDFYLGHPDFIQYSESVPRYNEVSLRGFAPLNVEELRLQKVIRHNDIVVETEGNGSNGVVVARGT